MIHNNRMMFGMLGYYPSPESSSVWSPWIEDIMNDENCGVHKVAMVKHDKKETVSCSRKFILSKIDIESIRKAMEDKSVHSIRIKDKVYSLLPRVFTSDPTMVVGESGDKYIVIGTSITMYIVVQIKKAKPMCSVTRGDVTPDPVRNTLEKIRKIVARLVTKSY